MSNSKKDTLNTELTSLEEKMHEANQFHTLEEQVADMKRRGIDPTQAYKDLDRKEEDADWGDATWKENGKWEPKTPADLDDKARENSDGDNCNRSLPPIV